MTPTLHRLLIIQPYVPRYRVAFFDGVVRTLATEGIRCRVSAAAPDRIQQLRGDATRQWWMIPRDRGELSLHGRVLTARGSTRARRGADAIVTTLSSTSPDTWASLSAKMTTGVRLGLWGHVRNYVGPASPSADRLRRFQARHADQVFAYTPGGTDQALAWGIAETNITTVMNTVDVEEIRRAMDATGAEDLEAFRRAHELSDRTAMFLGGLDSAKRVNLLAQALDHIWDIDRSFQLLLGGKGADRALLDRAVQRRQVVDLGFVDARTKALMAGASSALAMPGRIGLVAVEALAMRVPVVTMADATHAPEREYLQPPWITVTPAADARRFATGLLDVVRSTPKRGTHPAVPLLPDMINRFSDGCRRLLAAPPRHRRS